MGRWRWARGLLRMPVKATQRRVASSRSADRCQRSSSAMDDQVLDERHAAVMESLRGIHSRLDTLNGRTRESEQQIAVLTDRSGRINAVAISALSAVTAAAIYWVMR